MQKVITIIAKFPWLQLFWLSPKIGYTVASKPARIQTLIYAYVPYCVA
jgi:hypothetical protein